MCVPVLHCYADYKWTGPSEPIAQLCRELSQRGWRSDLACRPTRAPDESGLPQRARAMGVRVFDNFSFAGRANPWKHVRDVRRLSGLIAEGDYGIVHCHGTWDHVIAFLALRRSRRVPLVRTDHGAREYRRGPLSRFYYGPRMTDHLVVLSDRCAVRAVSKLGRDPDTVTTIRGAVDTDAFRPMEAPAGLREQFGLSAEDVIVGVVARVQRHRRFDVLLKAARIVRQRDRRVRIVVCGRGTHKASILDRPVVRMGLEDTVIPLGYRTDDYREVLSMFDAGLMLVPGSDGSCRAALQMAAMGKPLIVARRGVLPDVARDGETGIVADETPSDLAEAILEMAADGDRRLEWGRAARQRMCRHFSLPAQVDRLSRVYRSLLK